MPAVNEQFVETVEVKGSADGAPMVLNTRPLFKLMVERKASDLFFTSNSPIKVKIEDYPLCPRYSALVFENVTVRPSPAWLQARLTAIGPVHTCTPRPSPAPRPNSDASTGPAPRRSTPFRFLSQ